MRLFRKWLAPAGAVLTLLSLCGVLAADVVCRRERITGFDEEYNKAKKVFETSTTSDLSACEVYVGQKDGHLYFHSNFITEGYDNPTKIATEKVRDLRLITANLVAAPDGGGFSPAEMTRIRTAHQKQIKYYFDQSLFDSTGVLGLELKGAEKCYVLFGGAPPPKPMVRINPIRGPPFAVEFYPSLFVKVTSSAQPEEFFSKLQGRTFKPQETRFVSLIADSAIKTAIETSDVAKIWDRVEITSVDGLRDCFNRNKGRVVTLLGHVDGDDFVVPDVNGVFLFKVSPVEVEQMAEAAGCDAILLGCSSAKSGTPIGVDRPFNPKKAVERLSTALRQNNYFEFVQALVNKDMGLVFDGMAFDRTTRPANLPKLIEADVYARKIDTTTPRELVVRDRNLAGRMILVFAASGLGGGGSGGGTVSGGDSDNDDHFRKNRGSPWDAGSGSSGARRNGTNPGTTGASIGGATSDSDDERKKREAASGGQKAAGEKNSGLLKTDGGGSNWGWWVLGVVVLILLYFFIRSQTK